MGARLGFAAEILAGAFLFVLFVAMLSAGGAMLEQSADIPFTVGVLGVAIISLVVLHFGLNGLIWANVIFAPLMVAGGIFIGLYTFFNRTAAAFFQDLVVPGWILAAVVYASYNMVTSISVLASASKLAKRPQDCRTGGLLGGAVLTLLGICMALPLYLHFADIISVEIPFLVIVVGYGRFFSFLYLTLMLCAIITTAISNAFGFVEWARAYLTNTSRSFLCVVFVLLGIPAAHIGFSNIVGYVYPVFGLLGVFQIVVVLLTWAGFKKTD